jgi:hypothetical protein
VRAVSNVGQLRSGFCIVEACDSRAVTPSLHGSVDLELRDIGLVVVRQWQTLLLILLVGPHFIRNVAFHSFVRPLSFVNWLLNVELLVMMTFLRRMNSPHPLVASYVAILLGRDRILTGYLTDYPSQVPRVAAWAERWLLGHPVSCCASLRILDYLMLLSLGR